MEETYKCAICGKEISIYDASHVTRINPTIVCWDNGHIDMNMHYEALTIPICRDCEQVYNTYRNAMLHIIAKYVRNEDLC